MAEQDMQEEKMTKEDRQDDIKEIEENTEIVEKIEDAQPAERKVRPEFLLKFLIIATVVVVGILLAFYFGVVHSSKKVASNVAKVYASGTGEDLAELYAPGYVSFFEEAFSYANFVTAQQQYLDSFRTELQPDVGEIQTIAVSIDSLATASNVEDFASTFAEYGVQGVSKYKMVDMTWEVKGSTGKKEIGALAGVYKCDDGWFLDYVVFSYE